MRARLWDMGDLPAPSSFAEREARWWEWGMVDLPSLWKRDMDDLSPPLLPLGSSSSPSILNLKIKIPCQNRTLLDLLRDSSDPICFVKEAIAVHAGVGTTALLPAPEVLTEQIALIYNGQPLADDDKRLSDYNVKDRSTVYLLIRPSAVADKSGHGSRRKITLTMPDGKTSVIDFVEPWFTARDVKAVVESSSGLPMESFALSQGGKILDDEDDAGTFENGHFDADSPFFMVMEDREPYDGIRHECFQIVVRDCDEVCEETLSVSAEEKVLDIKSKIEKALGIHPVQQFLFHGKNTPQLDDAKTLGSYGLKDGSVVWLLGSVLKVYIKVPQASKMLELKVYSGCMISDIKRMIFEKTGIPVSSQSLFYRAGYLENLKSLESYSIPRNSIIYAIVGADEDRRRNSRTGARVGADHEGRVSKRVLLVRLRQKLGPVSFYVDVEPWYTIFDVKALVESSSEILICHQIFIYHDQVLEDWETVEQCGITQESVLFMQIREVTSRIYLNFCNKKADGEEEEENKSMVIEAKSFHKVDGVMGCIPVEQIEKVKGQPCLFLDEASQSGKLLAQCKMESGLILSLDRLIQINVRDVRGDLTKVDLKPWYSIDKAKIKVEERCGIPRELQMLTYKEEELEDTMTLGECEELFGCLWNLRWNCGGGVWSFFWPSYDGSSFSKNTGDKKWPREMKDFHGYF